MPNSIRIISQHRIKNYSYKGSDRNTDIIVDHPGERLDISGQSRAPVVIEAEYEPADNVENKAKGRFKTPYLTSIESIIALIYPETLRTETNRRQIRLAQTRLPYHVFYANNDRFPEHGWLKGSISDLADLIQLVAIPKSAFNRASDTLTEDVNSAVSVLENSDAIHLTDRIFPLLGLVNVLQTQRVLEDKKRELKTIQTRCIACAPSSPTPKMRVLAPHRDRVSRAV